MVALAQLWRTIISKHLIREPEKLPVPIFRKPITDWTFPIPNKPPPPGSRQEGSLGIGKQTCDCQFAVLVTFAADRTVALMLRIAMLLRTRDSSR